MDLLYRIPMALIGFWLVIWVLLSVIRTFMLPRSAVDRLARFIFRTMRKIYDFFVRRSRYYNTRDRLMAFYVPVSLLVMLVFWLLVVEFGFALIYFALGIEGFDKALTLSGSSMLTLGFASANDLGIILIACLEAIVGLLLVALLIAYLPTLYSAFSNRETVVNMLAVRAGTPPSAEEMFLRFKRIGRLDKMGDLWLQWEQWFTELQETHTTFAMLAFFRSPDPDHSWITASGAVLDAASLAVSTLDTPPDPQANLCIRAGFLALRRIADLYNIKHNPDPKRTDPISISQEEFNEMYERLAREGIPLKPDRELAWQDFAGWRVNYDAVLVRLCGLLMAPPAPWSSDRSIAPAAARRKK